MLRLLLASLATTAATITDCGSATSRFQLTHLDLFPDPPSPGEDVFMAVEFQNPGGPVSSGTARRTVSLNGLPVVDETVALCPDATECPLVAGFNNRSATSTWPDVTGKVVSTIRWYDAETTELLCIKTSVNVPTSETTHLRGSVRDSRPNPFAPFLHLDGPALIAGPANAVAIWYPVPEFNNSTQCSLSQQ
jgi:hypothetical protein